MAPRKTFEQYITDTLLGIAIVVTPLGILALFGNVTAGVVMLIVAFCLTVLWLLGTIARNTARRD
jgi:hypothetical protein